MCDRQGICCGTGAPTGNPEGCPAQRDENLRKEGLRMSRVLRTLLCTGMILSLWAVSAYAVTVRIHPQTVNLGAAGTQFEVQMIVEAVTDLGAFQFELRFNPSAVSIHGPAQVSLGPFLAGTGRSTGMLDPEIDNDEGALRVGAYSTGSQAGASGTGTLCAVTFTVLAQVPGALELEGVTLSDTKAKALAVTGVLDAVLTVSANAPPQARAGEDQLVSGGSQVHLNGAASSDPDDGVAAYFWEQIGGPAVVLSSQTLAEVSFTAPQPGSGSVVLIFRLTVTDHGGLSASDTMQVTVTPAPSQGSPPTAYAGPDLFVPEGSQVTLDGTGSTDPDGDIVSYVWTRTAGPEVVLSVVSPGLVLFTAPQAVSGSVVLTFRLTVTDAGGRSHSDSLFVAVQAAETPAWLVDGVYKDDPVQPSINAYIQTYTTGSVVVILTPDLHTWYVFIGESWTQGMDRVPDLAGKGHRLSLQFQAEDRTAVVLARAGAGDQAWTLQRVFTGRKDSPLQDGIYKEEPGVNLYLQTYEQGSAIFIFSPDLESWLAFLDENISDGLMVQGDLAGQGANLVMAATGPKSYAATITFPGSHVNHALERVFHAPYPAPVP